MSKQAKRKITVNISPKTKTLPKTRPSVFERLGTKAGSAHKDVCHHWAQHGTCPYGKGCKYSSTHTLISPSKQRLAKKENETKKRHSKEGAHKRLHSNVKAGQSPEEEWNQWDPTELEDADPDDLEKRRQELQRELEIQMKMENKARKKEKKLKRESSPSTESSSSSSDSSTSSDESSTTSSSSVETTRRKKTKKVKVKQRESSSSTDRERTRKHKLKNSKHSTLSVKSVSRPTDKSKKVLQAKPVIKITTKSPTPVRTSKKSQTPPPKLKTFIPVKKDSSSSKSPRPPSSTSDNKEKHRTPSPKTSKDKDKEKEREKEKAARDREREKEKEREREREKEKEKEREQREKEKEREREREKEKEREREREKEREREREKAREREKEREKEKEQKKRDTRSPRRDSKLSKDSKRKESPESRHSRDRKLSPSRSRGSGSGSSRRDNSRKNSPANCKDDRRSAKREDHDRSRGKDRTNDKNRKDKRDSRDRGRDRERERRIAREEREAAREKEREEALARCQERQRERERLKELAKKEEERRARDRSRHEDRGLDKPSGDRVERLLPLPADRIPPSRRGRSPEKERSDRDRARDGHRERTPDRNRSGTRKSADRHERLERDVDRIEHVDRDRSERIYDRGYERSERSYDRDPERERERERDYPSLTSRLRDTERRHDEKSYDSPYERSRHEDRRYLELEDRYNESSRDERISLDARDYPDDRRAHRELWDVRDERDIEREREIEQRRYGREDSRPPSIKGREWDAVDYPDHEWDRARRPLDWEARAAWDGRDHEHSTQLDEEWRHYNRSMDSWAAEERRRWPEWRDRSRPRSAASHRDEEVVDAHKRELPKQDSNDSSQPEQEPKKDSVLGKRAAEQPLEGVVEAKKPCVKEPPLEDDLSEISDDADEILNREEDLPETQIEENLSADSATKSSEKEMQEIQPLPASVSSQKSQSPNRTPNRLTKEESMDDENMDLDFEEISEDELEEETRVKGLGDALGVDWASLVAESRPRVKPACSAKRRWESHNILINLGISVEMAGEALVRNIMLEHAQAKIKEEKEEGLKDTTETKEQIVKKSDEDSSEIAMQIKQEPMEPPENSTENSTYLQSKTEKIEETLLEVKQEVLEIKISHPIAAIQVALREKEAIRKSLFASAGPYRRALSARRDLAIRRHLCNLPIKDAYVEAPKRHDPELLKQALQLFERSL